MFSWKDYSKRIAALGDSGGESSSGESQETMGNALKVAVLKALLGEQDEEAARWFCDTWGLPAQELAGGGDESSFLDMVADVQAKLQKMADAMVPELAEEFASSDEHAGEAANAVAEPEAPQQSAVPQGAQYHGMCFSVSSGKAHVRDPRGRVVKGSTLPKGAKVYVVTSEGSNVQVVTGPDEAQPIAEGDQVWTSMTNLAAFGEDVGLGNERANPEDAEKAAEIQDGLPPGRNPGASRYKMVFKGGWKIAADGKAMDGSLLTKVQRLAQWALHNDMVTSDIVFESGVRSPKTAQLGGTSYYIYEGKISTSRLAALPNGRDADGNKWYEKGWSREKIVENAKKNRWGKTAPALPGYPDGDNRRLPMQDGPRISRHCTGGAADVTFKWRHPSRDAKTNARADEWAFDEIYAMFGLNRPVRPKEPWHLEEEGPPLVAEESEDLENDRDT